MKDTKTELRYFTIPEWKKGAGLSQTAPQGRLEIYQSQPSWVLSF